MPEIIAIYESEKYIMSEVPAFFVPAATPKNLESTYVEFARWCDRPVPPFQERIYSITYIHDGEQWTATVGESLRGTRRRTVRSGRSRTERTIPLTDPAIVLAIFPENPYVVVTNHRFVPSVRSAWENPFYVGNPQSVVYFSYVQ